MLVHAGLGSSNWLQNSWWWERTCKLLIVKLNNKIFLLDTIVKRSGKIIQVIKKNIHEQTTLLNGQTIVNAQRYCKALHLYLIKVRMEDWRGGSIPNRGTFLDQKFDSIFWWHLKCFSWISGVVCHSHDTMWAAVELATELNFGKVEEDGK